ncbi:hypothetical protein [Pectobacterium aroidearum]|uniref:hypothetical protein n=1 Tax=Pectobacterium aroidearum TaxID=1201031 RepID=UPI002114B2E1|nr:hypothetical protein [Pectobacterium aroidearum]UUE34960.1 hypothetical protein L0Y26_14890 [Pectobacterium aroidearum]UUE39337.1 hypothetical protein L0Y25_14895 [Pectobacterium aroidearum]UUE43656.1 hypothetical protein L0Y28_13930 [Pectobacterium aroidearum]UUE47875.1 hypothetical protein L0Y23_13820 [Pectobacterium aroidearum]UUE52080.1 hypothetical protein L0Y30_13940 [Pectobacterium aroidearum]
MPDSTATPHPFLDTHAWPIVFLHMPEQVPDEESANYMAQINQLYARKERFVLCMTGADLPHRSPVFMNAYLQWTRDNLSQQQQYCAGAIRIESDDVQRQKYVEWAENWAQSGQAPYAYYVVATSLEAQALALTLLDRDKP